MKRIPLAFTALAALILALSSCSADKPILIGFSGCLTGLKSDLGVNGMYGVKLALDDVNARGGVKGRMLELVIRDDKADPATALEADKQMEAAGVVAYIGHMESGTIVQTLPYINEHKILSISPTISGEAYAGKDDWMLRVVTSGSQQSITLANMMGAAGIQKTAVLWDNSNRVYADSLKKVFAAKAKDKDNAIVFDESLNMDINPDYASLVRAINSSGAQALLVFASSTETATLLQNLGIHKLALPTYMAGWSMSSDLLTRAGKSIEGSFLVNNSAVSSDKPAFLRFAEKYKMKYGVEPTAGAILSYDAFTVLVTALQKAPNMKPETLRKFILNHDKFEGLQSDIVFDQYGDVHRPIYEYTVRDGAYILIGEDK